MAQRSGGFFKSYNRQKRTQLPEESFGRGMNYTNTPLSEGFSKFLVNYDLENNGDILRPRLGLKVSEINLHPKRRASGLATIYANTMMVADGRECSEANGKTYKQVLIGQPGVEQVTGSTLYKGSLLIGTGYPSGESFVAPDAVPPVIDSSIVSNELHLEAVADITTFKKPTKAEIHGLPLTDLNYIAKHVGTFAYNNQYYFFRTPAVGDAELGCTKFIDNAYKYEAVVPMTLTPKEAVMWGYNMLQSNPYTFANTEFAGTIQLLGMLPYDVNNNLVMTPQVNQELKLKCFYSAPSANTYKFVWEWKEPAAANWTKIKEQQTILTGLPELSATFSTPLTGVMVRITATKVVGGAPEALPEQVLTVGFSFNKEAYGSTANIKAVNYDLTKATGISYWAGRIMLWGLEDPTVLLGSDVNNPGYFPYPQGADIFDEPIIYGMPFLDNFIVFTSSKLHILTLSPDGLSWAKRTIQGGLDIKPWDIHLIRVVKNMVFFKSGNYFYMVVPKVSSPTGDLVIAPISKNIEGFFDDFKSVIDRIILALYDYNEGLELVHYYNYLDFEDIHNVYVFKTNSGLYINVVLLYNTISRTWRLYTHESQHIYVPFKQDATKKGTLVSLVPIDQRYKDANEVLQIATLPAIQFLQYTPQTAADLYVPANTRVYPADGATPADITDFQISFKTLHIFKNFQMLDTGYRDQASDYYKRYREIQLKFNNISQKPLSFYTDFLLDGELRKGMYRYETSHIVDPEDPNFGLLTMERILVDPYVLPGATLLDVWTLDSSAFPDLSFWKVRFPVSGKGLSPRLRIISYNEERYELLNTIWVFRPLYSR